jgi:cell division protein ZapA
MSNNAVPVTVRILEKEYRIGCPKEEQESLQETARYLNKKMKEIRDANNVVGTDRVAVMAALNIAHELLQSSGQGNAPEKAMGVKSAKNLQDKLETALNRFKQMEL